VSGNVLCDVSPYDRILVIRKTGTYPVINVPDKTFVDKGMLYCAIIEKETAGKNVYSLVYRHGKNGCAYIKRCKIEQFILNRGYSLVPEGSVPLALTLEQKGYAVVNYKPKPRVRVLQESFDISEYLIKGPKAQGVRLANREARSARFAKTPPEDSEE
jgi:topoisomerase-4 subunit A